MAQAHVMTFDTLAFVKKIEASGLDSKQAEAIAEAMKDVFDENLSPTIFTTADAGLLKSELKSDIKSVRSELKSDLFKLKSEMITWMVGLLFAQTAIMVSIVKFMH